MKHDRLGVGLTFIEIMESQALEVNNLDLGIGFMGSQQ